MYPFASILMANTHIIAAYLLKHVQW